MDLPTVARALGRVEEAQRQQDQKLDKIISTLAERDVRVDKIEKWQTRATGAMGAWSVVWAGLIGWMKVHGK